MEERKDRACLLAPCFKLRQPQASVRKVPATYYLQSVSALRSGLHSLSPSSKCNSLLNPQPHLSYQNSSESIFVNLVDIFIALSKFLAQSETCTMQPLHCHCALSWANKSLPVESSIVLHGRCTGSEFHKA